MEKIRNRDIGHALSGEEGKWRKINQSLRINYASK
jgi:hypothetical protein